MSGAGPRFAPHEVSFPVYDFTVKGVPVTQWGTRPVRAGDGFRHITEGGIGLREWRDLIAWAARAEAGPNLPIDAAVIVRLEFRFPAPKAREKEALEWGRIPHVSAGRDDLDKLERAVLDGLVEGGMIKDDALVFDLASRKWEYPRRALHGVEVHVERWRRWG